MNKQPKYKIGDRILFNNEFQVYAGRIADYSKILDIYYLVPLAKEDDYGFKAPIQESQIIKPL